MDIRNYIREKIELDIEIGDELLGGRFKNKKVIVKDIGKDEKNDFHKKPRSISILFPKINSKIIVDNLKWTKNYNFAFFRPIPN